MSRTKVRTKSAFILFIKGKKGRSMTGKQGTKTMLSLECSATMLRALFRYINWSTSSSEWILNFWSRVGAMIRELTFHFQCGLGSISYCTLLSFLFHLLQSYSSLFPWILWFSPLTNGKHFIWFLWYLVSATRRAILGSALWPWDLNKVVICYYLIISLQLKFSTMQVCVCVFFF